MWSKYVLRTFQRVCSTTALENHYYMPFNTLLTSVFPSDPDFQITICPHYMPGSPHETPPFKVLFTVLNYDHPALVLELQENVLTRGLERH